jgi:DNA-binding transcriptional LysR family regulator
VVAERLVAVEICAVLPARHRFRSSRRLTLAMIAEEPLVLLRRRVAPRLHDALISALHDAGVTATVRCQASQVHTCAALVAAGLGVGLLPAAPHDARGGVVYRRLVGPTPRLELGFVFRRDDPSEVLHAFFANARRMLAAREVHVLACEPDAPARAG